MNRPEKITAPRMERLYITKDKQEWVDIDQALLEKMRLLRKMQPDPSQVHGDMHGYLKSAEDVQGANCHKTALFLTGKISKDDLFAHTNHDEETAGHAFVASVENTNILPQVNTVKDLASRLAERPLPVRITFFKSQPNAEPFPVHSVTIIGITNEGRLLGFEKEDAYADKPFHDIDVGERLAIFIASGHSVGIGK